MATQRKKKQSRDEDEEEVAPRRKKRTANSGTSRRSRSERSPAPSSKGVIAIDFTKDESEGGRRRYPEADYHVKYTGFKTGRSREKDTPYVRISLQFMEGKYKGDKVTDDLYLTNKSLWRIRNFLEAMGVTVPKKKVNINFKKYIGKELGVTLGDDEFGGRIRSRVTDFLDLDTLRGADEDDEDFEDEDEEDVEDEDEDDEDEEDEDEDEDDEEDDDDIEEMDVEEDL